MNLPSTEELQRLLDEATPGPWSTIEERYTDRDGKTIYHPEGIVAGAIEDDLPVMWNTDGAVDWTSEPGNPRLAALAPVLAAEVIRLREENERLTRIEWLADQAAESDSGLAYDLDQINREYEGDQT